jgi:hypothetical protein
MELWQPNPFSIQPAHAERIDMGEDGHRSWPMACMDGSPALAADAPSFST